MVSRVRGIGLFPQKENLAKKSFVLKKHAIQGGFSLDNKQKQAYLRKLRGQLVL